jgi:uncharacterized protein (DUF885 family)
MRESPVLASSLGDRRYDDRWDDVSLAAVARREAHDRALLARVTRISRDGLSRADALTLDLFRHKVELAVEAQRFRLHLMPLTQLGGIQTADELAEQLTFETPKHFADWNARLRAFPAYARQTMELLDAGARAGLTHPRAIMQRVVAQLDGHVVDDPDKSAYLWPYRSVPAGRADREEARALVRDAVVPAFKELRRFFVERYLPACRESVAAERLPDGAAMYAHLVRAHTTTKLGPDEVHALGLREVARIRREMEEVKAKVGFAGPLRDFFVTLRTDPRFFYKTGEELLAGYREIAKRVDPELVKVFRRLPRTPYGVSPIADTTAPDAPTAYYRGGSEDGTRAGTFLVNLYKPEMRPKWEMVSLTLHEAVPGHHLQISLAMEDKDLPRFRRQVDYSAFVEGWALYAESLGDEMGLYDDPYARFGKLTYEMWRAVRLVVDTGLHHLGWDRQRAIDFFTENAPKSALDIANEIDRYVVWPGQATAYKIGELRIQELRRRTVGPRFDLKAFHDAVLRSGPLPLDLLEREVMEASR